MQLKTVRATEFQSIRDANEFSVGDITCLVGKNEAGKTAILQAMYRLNPVIAPEGTYSVTHDYPRMEVAEYERDVKDGNREPATVITAVFQLDPVDVAAVEAKVGKGVLRDLSLTLTKGYDNELEFSLNVDANKAIINLTANAILLPEVKTHVVATQTVEEAVVYLKGIEVTEAVADCLARLNPVSQYSDVDEYIFSEILSLRIPKFFYFDEYYQMEGRANIEALQQRIKENRPQKSDHPLLGLIHLAGLELTDLIGPKETRELKNRLEGAGNQLSKNVIKYWSQNRHLDLRFDVREGKAKDPVGMTTGTNVWGEVYDSRHRVTTELQTRSRGFVWFFSFLAWYSDVKRKGAPLILLLDEPGLSLHAKAQEDLLRYFDAEIAGNHQLIYTTHSPFMVDPTRFDRVRIVQDAGIDTDEPLPIEKEGTKVLSDVLDATGDSLFPLQGALGYEIYQTLFIGPNCLVVEGVSDLLYLQTISAILEEQGRIGLDREWTITPVGGTGKVPTFVAMIGAQKGLNVAVLIDYQKKDQQLIEDLFKRKLLKKRNVLTFADFTESKEADIEDMFGEAFYLTLVNTEYSIGLKAPIKLEDLDKKLPRLIQRYEKYFFDHKLGQFSHFRPARLFSEQIGKLKVDIAADTLERFEKAAKQLNSLLKK